PHGPTGLSRLRLPFRHPSHHKDSIVRPSCAALCEAVVSTRDPSPATRPSRPPCAHPRPRPGGRGGGRGALAPARGAGAGGEPSHPTAFRNAEMFAATLAWLLNTALPATSTVAPARAWRRDILIRSSRRPFSLAKTGAVSEMGMVAEGAGLVLRVSM